MFIYNEKYDHTDGMLVLARPSHSFLTGRADHTGEEPSESMESEWGSRMNQTDRLVLLLAKTGQEDRMYGEWKGTFSIPLSLELSFSK